MMKVLVLSILTFVLIVSLFGFALSQEELSVSDISNESADFNQEQITETLQEYEDVAVSNLTVISLRTVSLANGWAVKIDGSDAAYVSAIWISGYTLDIPLSTVKSVREQYRTDKQKIAEELRKLSTEPVMTATGKLHIGTGNKAAKYKLVKKEINESYVKLYVLPINSSVQNIDETNAEIQKVGVLELTKKAYVSLNLWTGTLVLDSGENAGTYNTYMASKTKNFNKPIVASAKSEKPTFWKRLVFWKKLQKSK